MAPRPVSLEDIAASYFRQFDRYGQILVNITKQGFEAVLIYKHCLDVQAVSSIKHMLPDKFILAYAKWLEDNEVSGKDVLDIRPFTDWVENERGAIALQEVDELLNNFDNIQTVTSKHLQRVMEDPSEFGRELVAAWDDILQGSLASPVASTDSTPDKSSKKQSRGKNAAASPRKPSEQQVAYEGDSVAALKTKAKAHGISGYNKMIKKDLIMAILDQEDIVYREHESE